MNELCGRMEVGDGLSIRLRAEAHSTAAPLRQRRNLYCTLYSYSPNGIPNMGG